MSAGWCSSWRLLKGLRDGLWARTGAFHPLWSPALSQALLDTGQKGMLPTPVYAFSGGESESRGEWRLVSRSTTISDQDTIEYVQSSQK